MNTTFNIVQIVDESTFIIDGGAINDVSIGDKFRIIGDSYNKIIDPKTKQIIDKIPTYKATIIAKEVYDNVSICKTKWHEAVDNNPMDLYEASKNLLSSMYQQVGHYEEVNVNHKQMKPLENHDDSPVNLGDEVELLSKPRE